MNPNSLPLIILLILPLFEIPACFSQDDPSYLNCRDQRFHCGNITNISYPFSGGDRPGYCGRPDYKLNCNDDDNITQVDIQSVTYRVLYMNPSERVVRLSRDDLWSDLCPQDMSDTSLPPNLFSFYSPADFQRVGLYYGCSVDRSRVEPSTIPGRFGCNESDTTSWNFYQYPYLESSGLGQGVACQHKISIYVNSSTASALVPVSPTATSALQEGLRYGFWVQWAADDENCSRCEQTDGMCGSDSNKFVCYCRNGTSDSICTRASRKQLSPKQKRAIIGTSLGVVSILLLGLLITYITRRRRLSKLDKNQSHNVHNFELNIGSLAPKRYSHNEIKRITKSFSEKLGQGGYGKVYKGWLHDGQFVAVKVLTETNDSGEEFINEVASISRTSHVNIVNLLGFCREGKRRALVYEFMPNKSLDGFIYKSGKTNSVQSLLKWEKLYNIAIGVARGLEYLHRGCNTRIVHFDIKPQNILLDENFCPKISDFGLAKLFKKEQSVISMIGMRGTFGYIAPEIFSGSYGAISHKSDVYSYGMVLLEMSGARKFDEMEEMKSGENYFFDKIYEQVVLKNITLEGAQDNEEMARKMLLVGIWCIQTAPSDRPSMSKVVEMLEGSIESIEIPSKPSLSLPKLSTLQFSSTFSVEIKIENVIEE